MNFKTYIALKEGLVRTYPLDLTIQKMNEKWEPFLTERFQAEHASFVGTVLNTNRFDLEKLKKDANFFGYFLSNIFKEGNNWTVVFAPKISKKDFSTKESFLYHFCPNSVLKKIKKIGITPRESTKKDWPHPGDRSYLLKMNFYNIDFSNASFTILEIEGVFKKIANASGKTINDYSVIKIKNSPELEESLRVDPSFPGDALSTYYGVYTNKNIPSSLFEKIMSVDDFIKDSVSVVVNTHLNKPF